MGAALSLLIPNSITYMVPALFILLFILSFMLLTKDGGPMMFFASLGAAGAFFWYFILSYNVRKSTVPMADSWYTINNVIASVTALHCLFILVGSKFYQFTWITMAALIALLTIQHINVLYFKTDG